MGGHNIRKNAMVGIGNLTWAYTKRGTPNKCWKAKYDDFLIHVLVEQVNKGLKCHKMFKNSTFVYAANAINARFNTNFTDDNVNNHYKTIKTR